MAEAGRDERGAARRTVAPADLWGLAVRVVAVAVLAVISIWLAATLLRGLVVLVLLAAVLAAGLRAPVAWLARRGLPRAAAVLVLYVAVLGGLALLVGVTAPRFASDADDLVQRAPAYVDRAADAWRDLRSSLPMLPPADALRERVKAELGQLPAQTQAVVAHAGQVAGLAAGVLGALVYALLLLLVAFYLLVDGARIREYLLSYAREEQRPRLRDVADRIRDRAGGWLAGQLVLSAVIGVLSYAGLALLGVPGAAPLGVLAAVGEMVPLVGPLAAAVPAILVALLESPWKGAATAVFFLVLQQLENQVLAPKVLGAAVRLHPLAVVLALAAGGALLGVMGALLAVPVAAAAAVVLEEWARGPSTGTSAARASSSVVTTTTRSDATAAPRPPRSAPY